MKSAFFFVFTVVHCIVTLLSEFRVSANAAKIYDPLPAETIAADANLADFLSFPLGMLADWLASQLDQPSVYLVPLVYLLNSFLWAIVLWHGSAALARLVHARRQPPSLSR